MNTTRTFSPAVRKEIARLEARFMQRNPGMTSQEARAKAIATIPGR